MKIRLNSPRLSTCTKTIFFLFLVLSLQANVYSQTGTVGSPFTELGMARNVSTAGTYYFNLTGTTFSSYVDANGYMLVATDHGTGSGGLPQGTALTSTARGILTPTVLSKLTTANEARFSSTTGNVNVVTSNATILSRITQNYILSRGAVDNTYNSSWTGTNLNGTQFTGCCGCTQTVTDLNLIVFHACGNGGGMHWVQTSNMHTESNTGVEIPSSKFFQLWVRAALVAVVNGPTINTQPSSSAQNVCLNSSATSLSVSASSASTITYQWYSNTSSSNSGGTLISGATSSSYTPPTNASGVKYYYVVCTHTGGSASSSVSGAISVSAISVAGSVSANQSVCSGNTASDITLSGNTGTVQWQISTDNSSFSNISGATSTTLASATIGTLTATRYYRAVVTNGVCSSVNSGTVTLNVTALPSAPSGAASQSFCTLSSGGCAVFGGNNAITSNAHADFALGTADFTYEAWIYPTSGTGVQSIFGIGDASSNSTQIFLNYPGQAGKIGFVLYGGLSLFSTTNYASNTWTHVAFVRQSGTLKLYINGTLNNSVVCSTNLTKNQLSIGKPYYNLNQEFFIGRITNTRLIKGIAQYTANFTPSTSSLNAASGTVLLVKSIENSSLLTDASASGHTLANSNSVTWNSTSPFNSTSSLVSDLTATGTSIQWFAASTGGSALNSSTTLVNGAIYYASQTVNSCTSGSRLAVTAVLTNNIPVPLNSPQNGDMIWSGNNSSDWSTTNNWYVFDGANFVVATSQPTTAVDVIIPVTQSCVLNQPSTLSGIVYAKDLIIETGATLTMSTGTLHVSGNYENNGIFVSGSGTVLFNGTAAQAITGTSTFHNMTISNTGSGVTLNNPVKINGTLTLTQGNIHSSSSNILEIGSNASTIGSVNWTSGTVVGPMKRWFAQTINSSQASGIFPIGNASNNRYAQINFTETPSSGGYIIAEYVAGEPLVNGAALYDGLPAVINGQMIQNYENEGYYEITPYSSSNVAYDALNNVSYDLYLRGKNLSTIISLSPLRIIKSSGHLAWNDNPAGDGTHVAPSGSNTDFIIGAEDMVGFSWFDIGSSSDNALPIELLSFSANCSDNHTYDIRWSTASEHNTSHFVVENSRDGVNWISVNEQEAAGNSTSILHYSFLHTEKSTGEMYYRLVQFDYDGESETFHIVPANCEENQDMSSMRIFPNPSAGTFYIDFMNADNDEFAIVTLSDLRGQVRYSESTPVVNGQNLILMKEHGLSSGIYSVSVQTENGWVSEKVVLE